MSAILFPYTTLFRSYLLDQRVPVVQGVDVRADQQQIAGGLDREEPVASHHDRSRAVEHLDGRAHRRLDLVDLRSEEHTSELQSRGHLVCRLLLEKKK